MRCNPRSLPALGAALVTLTLISACGGTDSSSSGTPESSGLRELRVGVSATANSLSVYTAEEEGIFAEHNIKVDYVTVTNGAEAIPMLVNDQLDVTIGDGFGTISAATNGLPLSVFGISTIQPSDVTLDPAIIFTKDKSVTVDDLSGKKFAVSALDGYHELSAKSTIDTLGGDSSKVEYVELAPASMADAVESGDVAGALITEPYSTAAEQRGLYPLAPQAVGTQGVSGTLWVATKDSTTNNADVLADFAASVEEAGHLVNKDRDLARTVAATYMTVEPEVINVMRFPTFTDSLTDFSSLNVLVDLALKYKMLDKEPDIDSLTVDLTG
ncbi:ABC transporter substrate-binding protein [Streptomyces sp. NPDC056716]|uniref:ABC transporter substrate-binding protein n=1 Tax=unclassified Streptomyces TaxID=2593676 RepID=UPI00368FEA98